MINVSLSESYHARELFHSLEHHLLVRSLFENNLEAQLFVDNKSRPQAGLIAYNNRFVFGGVPTQAAFNAELKHHFTTSVIPARNGQAFLATFTSDTWISTLKEFFIEHEVILAPRLSFEITPDSKFEVVLPNGFSLCKVTPELLASTMGGLETLREEMCSERKSVDDFFENSFGLCPVYENQITGWCLSEYNTGDCCEIGIATLEPHQRKGIATTLTKAFLAEASQRGYRHIGWDCWERNEASAATARKAGFTLMHHEQAMIVIL
jgi:GNAT superfamily N-acetyltransferase